VSYDSYHKRKIGKHVLKPETQMMGFGYDPTLSEGSLKPPIFLTSTFVFKTAQDGKDFFDFTSGRREPGVGQASGLVYSRFNNPNLEVLEDRLALWEGSETAAVFSSGMAAISTTLWAYVRPGDVILMSQPLYGGTETLIEKTLPLFGVHAVSFTEGCDREAVHAAAARASAVAAQKGGRVCLIMTETPANPTNGLVDLKLMREVSELIGTRQGGGRPPVAVDNTFLGPGVSSGRWPMARSGAVLADQVRRRPFGSGGGWSRRRQGYGGPREEAARRAGHATRSQYGVDDHAFHGDLVSAHAQGVAERGAGGRFPAQASEDRRGELPRILGRRRSAAQGARAAMRECGLDVRLQP
jgi:hypothetical protein